MRSHVVLPFQAPYVAVSGHHADDITVRLFFSNVFFAAGPYRFQSASCLQVAWGRIGNELHGFFLIRKGTFSSAFPACLGTWFVQLTRCHIE